MGEWGYFILIFVIAWILQVVLTFYQNKHYGQTVHEMSADHSPGYLGVGVVKKRFAMGAVVILVSDLSGEVVSAKELSGVTVFSRFKPVNDLIGKSVHTLYQSTESNHRAQATKMAAERIIEEQSKKEQPDDENILGRSNA